MEVLSSRVLLRPQDPRRSLAFYRDALGLSIYREWEGGTVFFLGGGFLEVSGRSFGPAQGCPLALWIQVPDLAGAHARLAAAGALVEEPPTRKPWGLDEMKVRDPDGVSIVVVEVPRAHPLRRRG